MLSPDFVKLAEAYGIAGHRVTQRAATCRPTVQAVRASGRPALIDFRVEKEESVYPMVPAGADLHAMIRRPRGRGRGGDRMKHTLVARVQRPARRPQPGGQPVPPARLQHRQPHRRAAARRRTSRA